MTSRGAEEGRHWADPRLPAYMIAGLGALVVAIAIGRPELVALGAPFVALAAIGLGPGPSRVRAEIVLHDDRVIESDRVEGEIRLEWEGTGEVEAMLAGWRGVVPLEPSPVVAWSRVSGRGPVTFAFGFRARSWGTHDLGALWVRLRRPGGLVVWEQKVAQAPRLRVLPAPHRLDRLLKPAEPRTVAGMHLSRLRGHGTDFAELRPYQQGDRLRDLSWATSARLGEPWVTVHHPERTGTVLLLIDAFFTVEEHDAEGLARTARAAWAVASVHLRAQDRVGLLARGGRTAAWVPPQGGRRARWFLLDELLTVGGAVEGPPRVRRRGGRPAVPADALVLGITDLRSRSFVRDLLHHRRVGHATAALVIDTSDLLPPEDDAVPAAAQRLWLAQRNAERHLLERGGVPTALVTPAEGVAPAISSLRRRMRAVQTIGARGRAR